jgi:nucleoside-diphosphate-sugar epimerase
VFISSAAVYEGHRGIVSPSTCLHPNLPYAISKMAAERYISFRSERGALDWATVLRLYYGYGPWDRPGRLIPRLVEASHSTSGTLLITAPAGSLVDPLYSEDIARAALAAASGKGRGETLDLCGGNPRTVPSLVREAARSMGWRLSVSSAPRPSEVPLRFHSTPLKAQRTLKLPDPTPLGEGIRRYVRWKVERSADHG